MLVCESPSARQLTNTPTLYSSSDAIAKVSEAMLGGPKLKVNIVL